MVKPIGGRLALVYDGILGDYSRSLGSDDEIDTFIPTFCPNIQHASHGQALAIDLGGTNLREAIVKVDESGVHTVKSIASEIPLTVRTGEGRLLFKWIAEMTCALLQGHHGAEIVSAGITWSYSLRMQALDRGEILHLGKGFQIKDLAGLDIKTLLEDAWRQQGLTRLAVKAITNDGVAAFLAAQAVTAPGTRVAGAVILATGTNACWPVPSSRLKRLRTSDGEMLVNVEWGSVGRGWILDLVGEEADRKVDVTSGHPGFEPFEYLTSGRYLGEVARIECHKCLQDLCNTSPAIFANPWSLSAQHCAMIEKGQGRTLLPDVSDEALTRIQNIVISVSNRSASLIAAALAALMKLCPPAVGADESIAVAIEGSLIEHYPNYLERLKTGLSLFLSSGLVDTIQFTSATDAALLGAAIAALSI